jgi:hypothetical protein
MSDTPVDVREGSTIDAEALFARAAASERCADRALRVAVDDYFLPEAFRLEERARLALDALLRALVAMVEGEIREHGAKILETRGEAALATALGEGGPVWPRLAESALLRDPELMAELLGRVRQELLSHALTAHAPEDPERPSLINRFVQHPDRVVSAGAMAVLIAESRRRSPEPGQFSYSDLPAELHHRLVWWVAAVLREQGDAADASALDQALCETAQRSLAAYDEGDRLEAAAMRFVTALAPQPAELPSLLVESLGDRRVVLFTALIAQAIGVDYASARDLVLDPAGDRLWLALRALALPREAVAQIGFVLSEADGRRDLEAFADALDAIATIDPEAARVALAPLRLDPGYRAARLALGGAKA